MVGDTCGPRGEHMYSVIFASHYPPENAFVRIVGRTAAANALFNNMPHRDTFITGVQSGSDKANPKHIATATRPVRRKCPLDVRRSGSGWSGWRGAAEDCYGLADVMGVKDGSQEGKLYRGHVEVGLKAVFKPTPLSGVDGCAAGRSPHVTVLCQTFEHLQHLAIWFAMELAARRCCTSEVRPQRRHCQK